MVLFGARAEAAPSTAFFYGHPVPAEMWDHYDRVVVDPDGPGALPEAGRKAIPLAYVSVGEVDPARPWGRDVDPAWLVGRNAAWKTAVADVTRAEWRAFLLDRVMAPLWAKGYRGFFFDTLDSYELTAKDAASRRACAAALASFVKAAAARFPGAALVLNRGFELLPDVAPLVAGVAAESLYGAWDPEKGRYTDVSGDDRRWLTAELREARDRWHLSVTAIDYTPSGEPEKRREIARKIRADGFEPWVTSAALDELGTGDVEVVPRRVLVVWNVAAGPIGANPAHLLVGTILEELGYAVDYVEVDAALPEGKLASRFAGIVTWVDHAADPRRWREWLAARMREHVPIAFLEGVGFDPDDAFLSELGVRRAARGRVVRVARAAPWMGLEAPPPRSSLVDPVEWVAVGTGAESLLRVEDAQGRTSDAVFVARWGGAALDPYVLSTVRTGDARWILDPYAFFRRALRLADLPAIDVTTESGRRILTAHIDGDGFVNRAEMPGTPYAGDVILERVLKRYDIPTTVSVIEGEVAPYGAYPASSRDAMAIARRIFALPNVELASHGFVHPFFWSKVEKGITDHGRPYHLPLPGYTFDLRREIAGSVRFIDGQLAPPDKRVKVFLWTGDALPSRDAVAITRELGLWNVNGGGSTRTRLLDTRTVTSPIALPFGDGTVQVYAPIQNDNIFTNDWHGPFYGFRQVIETFQLEGGPRRAKPLSLYYHFFSGSKAASMKALTDAYDYMTAQESTPLFVSDYAARADAFYRASLARTLDGAWRLGGLGAAHTVRIEPSSGWPDLARSRGVAGVRDTPAGRYVHLAGERDASLVLAPAAPAGTYLEHANAIVERWMAADGRIALRLRGYVPLRMTVRSRAARCTATVHGRDIAGAKRGDAFDFALPERDTGDAILTCS